jgi:hypothetical protein
MELTRVIAGVCWDYSSTRRHLVENGPRALMRRSGGIYELTALGEAAWRVERRIADNYLRW